jgi:hypothetical protein
VRDPDCSWILRYPEVISLLSRSMDVQVAFSYNGGPVRSIVQERRVSLTTRSSATSERKVQSAGVRRHDAFDSRFTAHYGVETCFQAQLLGGPYCRAYIGPKGLRAHYRSLE